MRRALGLEARYPHHNLPGEWVIFSISLQRTSFQLFHRRNVRPSS